MNDPIFRLMHVNGSVKKKTAREYTISRLPLFRASGCIHFLTEMSDAVCEFPPIWPSRKRG